MVNIENSFRPLPQPRLIVGNWKMHGGAPALAEVGALGAAAGDAAGAEVVMCLPATLIGAAAAQARHLAIGGQDCHTRAKGAFTGSVSAEMLADAGATWVIVGHSECRLPPRSPKPDTAAQAAGGGRAGVPGRLCAVR